MTSPKGYGIRVREMTEITKRIVEAIFSVKPGAVSSYGGIARRAGLANGARQVVRVLHALAEREKLPWHRIVRKDGSIALPPDRGGDLQAALLRAEGVTVSNAGKVDMAKYGSGGSSGPPAGLPR